MSKNRYTHAGAPAWLLAGAVLLSRRRRRSRGNTLLEAVGVLVAVITVAGRSAAAETPSKVPVEHGDPWRRRPFGVEGQLGVANPYGTLALALDYAPVSWLSINAGAGVDLIGPQVGVMPRVRFARLSENWAIFLAAGFSAGKYCVGADVFSQGCELHDERAGSSIYLDPAYWMNFGTGVEQRSWGGFTFRIQAGADVLLNPGDAHCRAFLSACRQVSRVTPALALAFGVAF